MRKREFLKKAGIISATTLSIAAGSPVASAAAQQSEPLVGLWEMTVSGKAATYHYLYAVSAGAWVASGNMDESFSGFKYGPTMGSYMTAGHGNYRYVEKGWVFDLKGRNLGTFRSQGTFTLSADGNSFRGPGTFTQFDLHGKQVFVEPFVATATKVSV